MIVLCFAAYLIINNPHKVKEKQISKLEELANNTYIEQKEKLEESIKNDKKDLVDVKKSKKIILGFNEAQTKKGINNQEKRLASLKDFKKKYIRLKERYSHSSVDERLRIALDYHSYMSVFSEIDAIVAIAVYGTNSSTSFAKIEKQRSATEDEVKELRVKQEEIENRFNELLTLWS